MNLFSPHVITSRFLAIWYRNWVVYLKTWLISFMPPLLEPILYIAAFGVGFRNLIGDVAYHGGSVSYVAFIAPALVASGIMNSSFFETTYSSFVRMYYLKTFDAIMAAPVSVEEVITGEIVWGATRSVMTSIIIAGVLAMFGLISVPWAVMLVPLALLGGLGFGALGMIFTGVVANIELFNLPSFLLITPMFLFSGTFFPLDTLPGWAQHVALALPLTHLTILARAIGFGYPDDPRLLWSVGYLVVFAAICFPIALLLMRRRLVR